MEFLDSIGKKLRYRRFVDQESGAIIAVPMDHGFTLGPISGLKNISKTTNAVIKGGATCVVVHKGNIRNIATLPPDKGIIIHVSGSVNSSPHSNQKVLTGGVEDVLRLGADGISTHVNVGATGDKDMIADLAKISSDASKFGVPVLAMMYARNDDGMTSTDVSSLAHLARLAEEAGADIVKVNASKLGKGFDEVVQGTNIPVIIAGGDKTSNFETFLNTVKSCVELGASGVSIGRNIFQQENPEQAISRVISVVREAMRER